jgi:hypothetical protein
VRHRAGPSPAVLGGRIVLAQAAVLPLPAAGLSLLLGAGGGLYWLVPAILLGRGGRGPGRLGAAHRDPALILKWDEGCAHHGGCPRALQQMTAYASSTSAGNRSEPRS